MALEFPHSDVLGLDLAPKPIQYKLACNENYTRRLTFLLGTLRITIGRVKSFRSCYPITHAILTYVLGSTEPKSSVQ
jgi:hypothetical protein